MKSMFTTAAIVAALAVAPVAAKTIKNPGFESKWTGWTDTDPSAISGEANSGSKAAKIDNVGGRFEQVVAIKDGSYKLTAYVKGVGVIGVKVGGETFSKSHSGNHKKWVKVTVPFTVAGQGSVTVFGADNGGKGRFDDFSIK